MKGAHRGLALVAAGLLGVVLCGPWSPAPNRSAPRDARLEPRPASEVEDAARALPRALPGERIPLAAGSSDNAGELELDVRVYEQAGSGERAVGRATVWIGVRDWIREDARARARPAYRRLRLARTDAQGSWRGRLRLPASAPLSIGRSLCVEHVQPGFQRRARTLSLAANENKEAVRLELCARRGWTVHGRVRLSDGAPVPVPMRVHAAREGVLVASSSQVPDSLRGSDFVLHLERAGLYELYAWDRWRGAAALEGVRVGASEVEREHVLLLARGEPWEGRLVDLAGHPLRGRELRARWVVPHTPLASEHPVARGVTPGVVACETTTLRTGEFVLPNLHPGEYELELRDERDPTRWQRLPGGPFASGRRPIEVQHPASLLRVRLRPEASDDEEDELWPTCTVLVHDSTASAQPGDSGWTLEPTRETASELWYELEPHSRVLVAVHAPAHSLQTRAFDAGALPTLHELDFPAPTRTPTGELRVSVHPEPALAAGATAQLALLDSRTGVELRRRTLRMQRERSLQLPPGSYRLRLECEAVWEREVVVHAAHTTHERFSIGPTGRLALCVRSADGSLSWDASRRARVELRDPRGRPLRGLRFETEWGEFEGIPLRRLREHFGTEDALRPPCNAWVELEPALQVGVWSVSAHLPDGSSAHGSVRVRADHTARLALDLDER